MAPGETAKRAPACSAAAKSAGVITVPAPTCAPSTSAAIARIASSATGVRSVTSIARTPPATSARAIGTASASRSITTTATTGPRPRVCASASWRFAIASLITASEDAGAAVGRADHVAEAREQLAPESRMVRGQVRRRGRARIPLDLVHQHRERAGDRVEADEVAVAQRARSGRRPAPRA